MPTEILQLAAQQNEWLAILPEIMMACTALMLLVLEILLPKKHHEIIPSISIAAQLGIGSALFYQFSSAIDFDSFFGLLHHTPTGQFMRLFFIATSVLVSYIGLISLRRRHLPRVEFFHLVLVVTAAMMLLAQSNHFISMFVLLETVAIGFAILVSYFRNSSASLEAGLKYLILGGVSSAVMLFGIMLLYGASTTPSLPDSSHSINALSFDALRFFLQANPGNTLASVGIVLVIVGVCFKIGAVPFQIWAPDVYQGAPTPVTAFLAVGSKAAGFAVLLILSQSVFVPYQGLVVTVLSVIAAATIIIGNISALGQHNVKRLMALSGVAHAGYLLIAVVAFFHVDGTMALGAIVFYLFAYLLAAMAVFGVMAHIAGDDDSDQTLEHYADLAKRQPFLAAVLAIGLGSLAGIPPLAGFIGKLLVFIAAFKAGLLPLLIVAIVGVVISIYYYFGWIKAAFFPAWRVPLPEGETRPEPAPIQLTPIGAVTLGCLVIATVVLGFYQGNFGTWLLSR